MSAIDDLSAGNMRDIDRRLRALETATPLNHASIGAGGVRVHSGGVITIQNGGLSVTGTASISGVLNADGTVTLSGTVAISGPFTVTGATALNGPTTVGGNTTVNGTLTTNGATDINGNLTVDGTAAINGVATLNNDLTVQGGGKIKAGVSQINPDGTVSFGGSKRITPDNGFGAFAMESGASSIQLTPSNADYFAQFSGGGYFQGLIRGMGLKLTSLPTTTAPANLHIDGSGNVSKSTA